MSNISELVGKTLTSVNQIDNDVLVFHCDNGQTFQLYHSQDCCESVTIEDICGDLQDLVGSPILDAREEVSCNETPSGAPERKLYDYSYTWTFYIIATRKGSVTIRWLGESNGYYSESVDFEEVR